MSTLNVPQQPSGKTINRSSSASSLRIEHEDDLVPLSRSRRNSESNSGAATTTPAPAAPTSPAAPASSAPSTAATASPAAASPTPATAAAPPAPAHTTTTSPGGPSSAAAKAGLIPLPQGHMQAQAENLALTTPVDWKEQDHLKAADPQSPIITLYYGKDKKPVHVHTAQLTEVSPYFKRLLAEDTGHDGKIASPEQTSFDDTDEFAMGLFLHWLNNQGHLHGPHDFHSLAHYMGLYVLARKFEIEPLENQVMDLVRHYYADQNSTAPAYRLEYIYTYTPTPNPMRTFMVSTAAFRCLEDTPHPDLAAANPMLHHTFYAPGSNVSENVKGVLRKNPDMAVDFIDELVHLHRNGEHDARHGPDCAWHTHEQTTRCHVHRQEPWQSDGADDEKPEAPKPVDPPPTEPKKAATVVEKKVEEKKEVKPAAPAGPVAPVEAMVAPKPAERKETEKKVEEKKVEEKKVEEKKVEEKKPEEKKVVEKKVEEKKEVKKEAAKTDDKGKVSMWSMTKTEEHKTTAPKAGEDEHAAVVTTTKVEEHHEETKTDDGPFKQWGHKMGEHWDNMVAKLHKKDKSPDDAPPPDKK